MSGSEPLALPLGYTPIIKIYLIFVFLNNGLICHLEFLYHNQFCRIFLLGYTLIVKALSYYTIIFKKDKAIVCAHPFLAFFLV